MANENLSQLHLNRFQLHCLLGMSRRERIHPQTVLVELSMAFDSQRAADSGKIQDTVDYVRTIGDFRFLLEQGEFVLIETAAEALVRYLLRPATPDAAKATIDSVKLKISKPEALPEAVPSLELIRRSGFAEIRTTKTRFGNVETIISVPDCAVHVVTLGPRQKVGVKTKVRESELFLGAGMTVQSQSVKPGTAFNWTQEIRRYENITDIPQTLLHVSHPAIVPWELSPSELPAGANAPLHPHYYYPSVMDTYLQAE
jgi:dihydroneopterin aldolase